MRYLVYVHYISLMKIILLVVLESEPNISVIILCAHTHTHIRLTAFCPGLPR